MNLLVYIFFFVPSVVGLQLNNKLLKKDFSKYDIIRIFVYILVSNIIGLSIIYFLKGFNFNIYNQLETYSFYAVRYSSMLIIINIIMAYLDAFLAKNFDIYLTENNEKNSKKNNSNK